MTWQRQIGATSATFTWRNAQAGARAFGPTGNPAKTIAGMLMLADTVTILLASFTAYLVRHGLVPIPFEVASTTLLGILLTLNAMQVAGGYRGARTTLASRMWIVLRSWSVAFAMLLILAYLTKLSEDFSRMWAIGWYGLALAGFMLVRIVVAMWMRHWERTGQLASTLAIVDLAGNGEALARQLVRQSGGHAHLVGVFSAASASSRRNGVADLIELSRLFRIDDVIVSVSGREDGETVNAIVRKLGTIPTSVHICPEIVPMTVAPREVGLLYGQAMLTVYQRPFVGWGRIVKRIEDIVIASAALVVVMPLLLILAILIKLDSPGPVLFRQRRLGFNNNVIMVLKLRSMLHAPQNDAVVPQAKRNDQRVSRIGRFLRRSSLDELPQLINVLRGEMSLVGPRPHALAHNELYAELVDDYLGRHRVRPGITGWAQVNGLRGETDTLEKMQRRVEHDLAYIDSWSLVLDVKILCLTVSRGMFGTTAY